MRPPIVATIEGWELTRWTYDNAPLVATRGEDSVDIQPDGALDWDMADDGYQRSPRLPRAVLIALIDDARKRGVWPEEERTK